MGNSESSDSQFPPPEDDGNNHQRNRDSAKKPATEEEREEAEPSSVGTALKVGAAVAGTAALLALGAWNRVSSSSSEAPDDRRHTKLEGGSSSGGGGYIPGDAFASSFNPKPYSYQPRNLNRSMLKIMSYNVWFREDVEVYERMIALGDLIQHHTPDVICFQEVTANIYEIFESLDWWKAYKCSVSQKRATERPYFCMQMSKLPVKAFRCKPFDNSVMGRELCLAHVDAGMDKELVIATSHLESPTPAPPLWNQMHSTERVAQAEESLSLLNNFRNVIFGGDMNWDEMFDGSFPLPDGWVDAWTERRPGENGWTYDTKANRMLSGNFPLQKRLDRFICNLTDFEINNIEMIGMEAIPGLHYRKEKRVRNKIQNLVLPVLPSDHYGLLLTICNL